MGLRDRLVGLAIRDVVPVFAVVGVGGRRLADDLPLVPGVEVVDSPRAAHLLLLIGRPTRALLAGLLAAHDQLASPRGSVWWPVPALDGARPDAEHLLAALPEVVTSRPGDPDGLRAVFAELLGGARPSAAPVLLDMPPAKWRGVGPYGTGGEGMMGGVPYGRPMAMTAADPDGLELDQLHLQVGPMLAPLPAGLILDLELQGDVIRTAAVGDNPYRAWPGDPPPGPLDTDCFLAAATAPASVAALEVARAAHHLRAVARMLRLRGLGARGLRVLDLARAIGVADRGAVEALAASLGRSRSLGSALAGVGVVDADTACSVGGPVARAAGFATDARLDDPGYRGLAFEPVTHDADDARARFLQRLAEAGQALELAERSGDRRREPGSPLEGPRGSITPGAPLPSAALIALLPQLLAGQEWGDAMTTVVSLELDVEEAAATAPLRMPSIATEVGG
ncbi:hypothetical protein BH20ACT2_BH20ACT2_18920 [soil metagenome]